MFQQGSPATTAAAADGSNAAAASTTNTKSSTQGSNNDTSQNSRTSSYSGGAHWLAVRVLSVIARYLSGTLLSAPSNRQGGGKNRYKKPPSQSKVIHENNNYIYPSKKCPGYKSAAVGTASNGPAVAAVSTSSNKHGSKTNTKRELSVWIWYTIVGTAATLCYVNSLHGELVHDDIMAIVRNPDVRSDTPWTTLLTNDFWGKPLTDPTSHKSYRPLCVLTFR